jgi:hypothetical protein
LGGALHVSAHTHAHTHIRRQTGHAHRLDALIPIREVQAFMPILEVQTVAPQACPRACPPTPHLHGAMLMGRLWLLLLNWATTAPTAVPCSQRGAAQHQTRLRDHAQQVWIEQRVLDKHESTHVSTFTCEALVRPLGAHTRSAALLSPSMA